MKQGKLVLSTFEGTDENPAMIQMSTDKNLQNVFVHALAVERDNESIYAPDKIIFSIISGTDSALQAIKASVDLGASTISFGKGKKGLSNFEYSRLFGLKGDKGCYEKRAIPMPSGVYNAIGMVHNDVSSAAKYILSTEGKPHEAVADLLRNAYQIGLLDEWKMPIFKRLIENNLIKEHEHFYNDGTLPNLQIFTFNMDETSADNFISDCLKTGYIKFPQQGDGSNLSSITTPAGYLIQYGSEHAKRVQEVIEVGHDPLRDNYLASFDEFKRQAFPVQAHASTAIAKMLHDGESSALLQGEMSSGKSFMLVAAASAYMELATGVKHGGSIIGLVSPPSLTKKWPKEIKAVIPNAVVHVIKKTSEFIRLHQDWLANGKQKSDVPTYFIFSYSVLRNCSAIEAAAPYVSKVTKDSKGTLSKPYKEGFICPDCGLPHQSIDSTKYIFDEVKNIEVEVHETHTMTVKEWGNGRRSKGSFNANSVCYHCGSELWTKRVGRRYNNYAEWANRYAKPLISAITRGNQFEADEIRRNQPDFPSSTKNPRRIASAEYIRRKVKNFFDVMLVDEVHLLKGGNTAQGQALSVVKNASKKTIAATGSLFGGKAEDIYYIWWRLFPQLMSKDLGYKYHEVSAFNTQFGNTEKTYFEEDNPKGNVVSNKQSRGERKQTKATKVIPGYSPFTFPALMLEKLINVRLVDVWPDPVALTEIPTIMIEPTEEQKAAYGSMISDFEYEINSREDGFKLYSQMLDYGVSYLDNCSQFPPALFKNETGEREVIVTPSILDADVTYPKEEKLQEIVKREMSEGRASIVYIRDTGSSVAGRDVRPRLMKKLEEIGAKVCILHSDSPATNNRSEWLENKIINEGYNVCIVSQELVKVGLDLLCTPTLIYYQFSWSLFTYIQSSRRAWRIGQTKECRIYSLAYTSSYQSYMAELIAKKERASQGVNGSDNGDGSSGLSAMLGDEGDLQSMLIKSIKDGSIKMNNTAEDWISGTSDRARELLANIGLGKVTEPLNPTQTPITAIELAENTNLFEGVNSTNDKTNNSEIREYTGEIKAHSFIKTETMMAFEFTTHEDIVVMGEVEIETSLFRFEHHLESNDKHIMVASLDDYYVYDTATQHFDLNKIEDECRKQHADGCLEDATNNYIDFFIQEEKDENDGELNEEVQDIVAEFQALDVKRTVIVTIADAKKKSNENMARLTTTKKPVVDDGQLTFAF